MKKYLAKKTNDLDVKTVKVVASKKGQILALIGLGYPVIGLGQPQGGLGSPLRGPGRSSRGLGQPPRNLSKPLRAWFNLCEALAIFEIAYEIEF